MTSRACVDFFGFLALATGLACSDPSPGKDITDNGSAVGRGGGSPGATMLGNPEPGRGGAPVGSGQGGVMGGNASGAGGAGGAGERPGLGEAGGVGGRVTGNGGAVVRQDAAVEEIRRDGPTVLSDAPTIGGIISLRRDLAPLVIRTCGVIGCHVAGSPQAHGMDLVSADKIFRGWVNVKGFDHCNEEKGGTAEFPARITPSKTGDRDSYVLVKVSNTVGLCGTVSQRMPPPPALAWTAVEVDLLRQWILQGAQNN